MKLILLWLLVLSLGACTQVEPEFDAVILEPNRKEDYRLVFPFNASPVRQYHGTYLGRADFLEVGSRLEQKSKIQFPVNMVALGEGQILDNTRLSRLVRRESADNPYGLNPPSGSLFETGNGQSIQDAVVVADVVELNFFTGTSASLKLAGASFAIVLNQTLSSGESISDQRLYDYGATMGRKLDRFVRSLTDLEDLPIYIALYSTNRSDATLPGRFIGDGVFTARGGQFSLNQEKWVLFPSVEANALDQNLSNQFSAFRSDVIRFIPESIGVIAEARYVDESIHEMRITLTIQAKTYTEVHALVQFAATQIMEFSPRTFRILVRVNTIDETLAMIERTEQNNLSIIYTY